jgi:hypothetical protein
MSQELNIESAQDKLTELQAKQRDLAKQLSDTEFIWNGSITKRFLTCGTPSCRCHTDPEAKHGPYYYWTTKKAGKTVSKSLSEKQAGILIEWIENRRKLEHTLSDMKKLSEQAYEVILFIMNHSD